MKLPRANSIRGFTLFEMILAMLITVIVVTSAYQIIFYIHKQWNAYNKNQSELLILIQFEETLSRDITESYCIRQQNKLKYDLILKNDTITYDFHQQVCRKHKQIRDTFNITINKVSPKYLSSSSDSSLILAIKFEIKSPLNFHGDFVKHYTSSDLISLYPYGIE